MGDLKYQEVLWEIWSIIKYHKVSWDHKVSWSIQKYHKVSRSHMVSQSITSLTKNQSLMRLSNTHSFCNPLHFIKYFCNMNPLDDPQHLNPALQLSASDSFFCNTHGLSFNQATFNLIHGNMTVSHSGERRSQVCGVKSITAKKNWLHSSGILIDGLISISKHYNNYVPVPRALWPWKWSRWLWLSCALKCIASTPMIGKMFLRIIWNLSNHHVFCFPGIPFHEFWHIL